MPSMARKKRKVWSGAQIKALRTKLELLQTEAAEWLRVSQALWADWEREHRKPSESHKLLLDLLESGELPPPESD